MSDGGVGGFWTRPSVSRATMTPGTWSGRALIPADTDPEAYAAQTDAYRRMGGPARSAIAFRLTDMARRNAVSGIRRRHPEYDDAQVRSELCRLGSRATRSGVFSGPATNGQDGDAGGAGPPPTSSRSSTRSRSPTWSRLVPSRAATTEGRGRRTTPVVVIDPTAGSLAAPGRSAPGLRAVRGWRARACGAPGAAPVQRDRPADRLEGRPDHPEGAGLQSRGVPPAAARRVDRGSPPRARHSRGHDPLEARMGEEGRRVRRSSSRTWPACSRPTLDLDRAYLDRWARELDVLDLWTRVSGGARPASGD